MDNDINRELAEDAADPFHCHINYTDIPETQTILWREGWGDTINRSATMVYDFRERKMRDALIELGWTSPHGK